jgi:hypothetical protein
LWIISHNNYFLLVIVNAAAVFPQPLATKGISSSKKGIQQLDVAAFPSSGLLVFHSTINKFNRTCHIGINSITLLNKKQLKAC